MSSGQRIDYEDEVIQAGVTDGIAVVTIKCNVYGTITDLAESGKLLSFFHAAEIDPGVTALLLTHHPECFNQEQFDDFLGHLRATAAGAPVTRDEVRLKNERLRYTNVLNRFILQLADFKKISVAALNGEIVTPFLGTSLAADFRFASASTVFTLAPGPYGQHPGGALPFFLPRYLGYGRAAEILLTGKSIPASEALAMGLVNRVLPGDDFLARCVAELRQWCTLSPVMVANTKVLLANSRSALKEYFEREAAFLH